MRSDEVIAYAAERLGSDVQAAELIPTARQPEGLRVWELMTERGWFWLVEWEGVIELFRAHTFGTGRSVGAQCRSPGGAARRFLELHGGRLPSAAGRAP